MSVLATATPLKARTVQLREVAHFWNGAAFKPEDWEPTGSRIIRIQNLTDPSKPFNRTTRDVPERLMVHPGDLLVSWSASLGVFVWEGPDVAVLNQHIFRVVPNSAVIDQQYLRHALERCLGDMRRHLHGATMQHVNRDEFLSTTLFLPSLPEQRRIAAILDKADELRAKRRTALGHLNGLTQAVFLEMFGDPVANPKGWHRTTFSELLTGIEGGWSPVCLDRPVTGAEWGVLKLGAVTWCDYDPGENKALPANLEPDPTIEVNAGDVIFTRKNTHELVAACTFVALTPPRLMMSDLMFRFRFRPDAEIEPRFLQQLLVYPTKRSVVQKLAGGTAGSMPNISKERLRTIQIELPPLELQRQFTRAVEHTESLKASYRRAIEALDSMFASLQHRAFTGEL